MGNVNLKFFTKSPKYYKKYIFILTLISWNNCIFARNKIIVQLFLLVSLRSQIKSVSWFIKHLFLCPDFILTLPLRQIVIESCVRNAQQVLGLFFNPANVCVNEILTTAITSVQHINRDFAESHLFSCPHSCTPGILIFVLSGTLGLLQFRGRINFTPSKKVEAIVDRLTSATSSDHQRKYTKSAEGPGEAGGKQSRGKKEQVWLELRLWERLGSYPGTFTLHAHANAFIKRSLARIHVRAQEACGTRGHAAIGGHPYK